MLRVARRQQACILQFELAMPGFTFAMPVSFKDRGEQKLELRIPAAPLAVAVTAIRVQIRSSAGVQVLVASR